MRLFGIIAAFGLSLVLTGSTRAADKPKQTGEKTQYIFGTVTDVKKANGKDDGSITVKTFARHGKAGSEKTIRVTKSTRFEKAGGTVAKKSVPVKKSAKVKTTKHRTVKGGKHIVIIVRGDKHHAAKKTVKNIAAKKSLKSKKTGVAKVHSSKGGKRIVVIVRGDKHHAAKKMDIKAIAAKMVAAKKKAQALKVSAKKAGKKVAVKKDTKVKKASSVKARTAKAGKPVFHARKLHVAKTTAKNIAAKKSLKSKKASVAKVHASKAHSFKGGKRIIVIVRGDKHHAAKMVAAKKADKKVSAKKTSKVKKAGTAKKTSKVVKKTAGVNFDSVKAGERVILLVRGDKVESVRILSLPTKISKTTTK